MCAVIGDGAKAAHHAGIVEQQRQDDREVGEPGAAEALQPELLAVLIVETLGEFADPPAELDIDLVEAARVRGALGEVNPAGQVLQRRAAVGAAGEGLIPLVGERGGGLADGEGAKFGRERRRQCLGGKAEQQKGRQHSGEFHNGTVTQGEKGWHGSFRRRATGEISLSRRRTWRPSGRSTSATGQH